MPPATKRSKRELERKRSAYNKFTPVCQLTSATKDILKPVLSAQTKKKEFYTKPKPHKMKTKIKNWLTAKTKTYQDGLKLYNIVKRDNSKDKFFHIAGDSKPGPIQMNILIQELRTILRKLPSTPTKTIKEEPNQAQKKTTFFENLDVDLNSLPEEAKEKYRENKTLTIKLSKLHQQLKQSSSQGETKKIAEEITETSTKREKNWQEIKHAFKEKKQEIKDQVKELEDEKAATIPLEEVVRITGRITTIKSNLNRVKRELNNPSDFKPKQLKARERSKLKWEEELAHLTALIKNDRPSS